MAGPKRMHWKVNGAKPMQAEDLKDGTKPKCTRSKADGRNPVRVLMMTKNSKPIQARLRIKIVKSGCRKSKTGTSKSKYAIERNSKEKPI